jgi:hypothetical protein
LDGVYTDSVGSANGVNSSFANSTPLCEDASNSVRSNNTTDRISLPTTTDINGAVSSKSLGGWLKLTSIQLPPKSIYREGTNGTNQFNLTLWAGNKLMLDIRAGSTDVLQAFSDNILKPNRTYHVFAKAEGTNEGDTFALYIDGVKQGITVPANRQTGVASFLARPFGEFADPSGLTQVGAGNVLLNAPTNADYNYWSSFTGTPSVNLTDEQIREELFEKGALAGVEITNQVGLDALSSTVRPDEPLNIRVADNGGDLTLTADNITHDPLASVHVQWMGTGNLTYVNTNGSNASIGSTPNGGTINFVNPSNLTVSPLFSGSSVRIYEAGTTNLIGGNETTGTSYSEEVLAPTIDVVVESLQYKFIKVKGIDMTGGDVSLPVSQELDRNYRNP